MSVLLSEEKVDGCRIAKKHIIRQIWVSALANLLQAMQGFVVAMSSIMIPQLLNPKDENELALTEDEATWFASLYCLGYLSGSFVGAFQGNYFGQRVSLIIDCCTASAGLLFICFAPSFEYLVVGRLLCGHASGSGTVTIPIFTCEISIPSVRGITGSFLLSFYLGGYSVTVILGSLIHWRTTMIALTALPIISGVSLFFVPNSPVWLLRKGRDDEAIKSLTYFRGDAHQVQVEYSEIKNSIEDNGIKSDKLTSRFMEKLRRFKSPEVWKPLLICIALTAGFVEWGGLGPIAFYMVTFIEATGIPLDPYFAASINAMCRAIFGMLSTKWISKFPRRRVFLTCIFLMFTGCVIMSGYHYFLSNDYFVGLSPQMTYCLSWIPAVGYIISSLSYSSGYVQISYMTQGEVFPADIKSFACGISCFIDGISMFFSAKTALFFLKSFGVSLYFGITSILIALSFLFAWAFLPETQGKTLQEIENELKKK